jgi:hypothetical protein
MKQGLPESARDALARRTTADEHPSADLLSGFAEQALSAAEKKQVMTHLAACAECREVAFLASSAMPQERPVSEVIAAPGWRRWMSWKWIVPLATAIVIAVAVIPRPENPLRPLSNEKVVARNQPSTLSQGTTAPNDTRKHDTRQTNVTSYETKPPAVPPAVPKVAEPPPPQAKRREDAVRQLAQVQAQRDADNAELSSSLGMSQSARSVNEPAATAAPPASPPAQSVASKDSLGKSAAGAPVAPAMKAEKSAAASQTVEVTSAAPLVTADSTAAAPPPLANATSRPGQSGALYAAKSKATPLAHWRITNDGQLQRSFESSEWTRVLAEQPVAFRAVAVVGSQVWAGGSGGGLFHSTDDGAAWTKVELAADGQAERGAIVSMHFDSVLRGSVTTDSGSTWLTADGGKSWIKQ